MDVLYASMTSCEKIVFLHLINYFKISKVTKMHIIKESFRPRDGK